MTEYDDACGHSPSLTTHVKRGELWKLCEEWMKNHEVECRGDIVELYLGDAYNLVVKIREIVQHQDPTDE